jgi:hypothetical protein
LDLSRLALCQLIKEIDISPPGFNLWPLIKQTASVAQGQAAECIKRNDTGSQKLAKVDHS